MCVFSLHRSNSNETQSKLNKSEKNNQKKNETSNNKATVEKNQIKTIETSEKNRNKVHSQCRMHSTKNTQQCTCAKKTNRRVSGFSCQRSYCVVHHGKSGTKIVNLKIDVIFLK